MSITVKIKTKTIVLSNFSKSTKQKNRRILKMISSRSGIQSTQQSRNDNLLFEYSQYLEDPATKLLSMLQ